ncbi:MAG: hypothetical protein FWJ68_15390 [Planifilum fulgidum]
MQFIHDTWDRADKGIQLYTQYQDFQRLRGIVEGTRAGGEILQGKGITKWINSLKQWNEAAKSNGFALSKLGKGIAIVDITLSGTETVMHTVKAINSTGQDRTDAIFDAIGSGGDVLFAAGTLAGPTPLGVTLMVTGTVLGAVSWGYKHREVFKKAWSEKRRKEAWKLVGMVTR